MLVRIALVALAAALALLPLRADAIERAYARGVYPAIQTRLTGVSNLLSVALFDVLVVAVVIALVASIAPALERFRRMTWWRAAGRLALSFLTLAAALYLVFLLVWGLNYRRVALSEKLDFSVARATPEAARALAARAVTELNALHAPAHEAGFIAWADLVGALGPALVEVHRGLGGREVRVGVPKWSALTFYFERAGVDGMTNPLFLEVLVNRALLPFERPAVVAHEWAHLAGFADEGEANFVGWLTCLRGGPAARYSGWLAMCGHALAALPARERAAIATRLAEGPRRDFQAIARRQARISPALNRAGWRVYDRYLRANRVEAGVASYHGVVLLALGTRFDESGAPQLRSGAAH